MELGTTGARRLAEAARRRRDEELGLTQDEVYERGGPSTDRIMAIEAGRALSYTGRTIRRLEDALQWQPGSVRRIVEGEDPIPVVQLDITTAIQDMTPDQLNTLFKKVLRVHGPDTLTRLYVAVMHQRENASDAQRSDNSRTGGLA